MANAQLSNEPKNVQNGDLEMNQRHQNNLMKYLRHPVQSIPVPRRIVIITVPLRLNSYQT